MAGKKGYSGKRPLWHWLLLYLIIGLIVYGMAYYFVFGKNGKSHTYQSPGSFKETVR